LYSPPPQAFACDNGSEMPHPPQTRTNVLQTPGLQLPVNMVRMVFDDIHRQVKEGRVYDSDRHILVELAMDLESIISGVHEASMSVADTCTDTPCMLTNKECSGSANPGGDTAAGVARSMSETQGDVVGDPALQPNKMQDALIEIFRELDEDGSGTIGAVELRRALAAIGVPRARATKLLNAADASHDGNIDLEEWRRVVGEGGPEMQEMAETLVQRHKSTGSIFASTSNDNPFLRRDRCMIHPDGWFRRAWDMGISIILAYLAVVGPFFATFASDRTVLDFRWLDQLNTAIFFIDLVLNFRTGYWEREDLCMNGKLAAIKYLQSWFILDFVSTIPFEYVRNLKLLKLSKVLRLSKAAHWERSTVLSENVEDFLHHSMLQTLTRPMGILVHMGLLCHWLACALKFFDRGALSQYQDVSASVWREYLAAFYWAMTTITTVGYGDITPASDGERFFAMIAMVVGGSFYGYVIGTISSIIANRDLNRARFQERMDEVQAWLDHNRFPAPIRRRIRRYLKSHLSQKAAIDLAEIMNILSPELQEAAGTWLIHDDVKSNPLFDGLSVGVLALFLHLLTPVRVEDGAAIVKQGEPGKAMFVIIQGVANLHRDQDSKPALILCEGDSFGEEIVLQLAESYEYSVEAKTQCSMFMIPEAGFLDCFATMPDVIQKMKANLDTFTSVSILEKKKTLEVSLTW